MPNAIAPLASFKVAAENFANDLHKSFASKMLAQPEDQLKGPVQALIKAARGGVITKTEAQVKDLVPQRRAVARKKAPRVAS